MFNLRSILLLHTAIKGTANLIQSFDEVRDCLSRDDVKDCMRDLGDGIKAEITDRTSFFGDHKSYVFSYSLDTPEAKKLAHELEKTTDFRELRDDNHQSE